MSEPTEERTPSPNISTTEENLEHEPLEYLAYSLSNDVEYVLQNPINPDQEFLQLRELLRLDSPGYEDQFYYLTSCLNDSDRDHMRRDGICHRSSLIFMFASYIKKFNSLNYQEQQRTLEFLSRVLGNRHEDVLALSEWSQN